MRKEGKKIKKKEKKRKRKGNRAAIFQTRLLSLRLISLQAELVTAATKNCEIWKMSSVSVLCV